jgi:hypothetical protein
MITPCRPVDTQAYDASRNGSLGPRLDGTSKTAFVTSALAGTGIIVKPDHERLTAAALAARQR